MKTTVSFVIPCLNEEKTLPIVLEKIRRVIDHDLQEYDCEIIVSDNGSTDSSVEIAKHFSARVNHCVERGYGAALQSGFRASEADIIVFADADDTYDFLEAPKLIRELSTGADMVSGSRLRGTVHKGAMPFLHQYLGTPVLNMIINFLFAHDAYRVTDCNCGFRCFDRKNFMKWGVQGTGMEFITEMLVRALLAKAVIKEVPIALHPDKPGRLPHLRTWRDGMRNLLQIFVLAPTLFLKLGICVFVLGWFALLSGYVNGPIQISGAYVLGIHSMMVASLLTTIGISLWSVGMFIVVKHNPRRLQSYEYFINMSEDKLFWRSLILLSLSMVLFLGIIFAWAVAGYANVSLEKQTLFFTTFATDSILLITSTITAHIIKRT